jgi:hypothetical protein
LAADGGGGGGGGGKKQKRGAIFTPNLGGGIKSIRTLNQLSQKFKSRAKNCLCVRCSII